jgi:hypothetical protein
VTLTYGAVGIDAPAPSCNPVQRHVCGRLNLSSYEYIYPDFGSSPPSFLYHPLNLRAKRHPDNVSELHISP